MFNSIALIDIFHNFVLEVDGSYFKKEGRRHKKDESKKIKLETHYGRNWQLRTQPIFGHEVLSPK